MLRAWQSLPEIPLMIAGNGPLKNEINRIIEARNLKNIEVHGQCSHDSILSMMKEARLLIFPSEWYEGFPMTIAEAFACGIPVVAPRLGAMTEIVDEERTGLHFTPGDPEHLASKVKWSWAHHHEMKEMGKEARKEYELKYTAKSNYGILIELYIKAMRGSV